MQVYHGLARPVAATLRANVLTQKYVDAADDGELFLPDESAQGDGDGGWEENR